MMHYQARKPLQDVVLMHSFSAHSAPLPLKGRGWGWVGSEEAYRNMQYLRAGTYIQGFETSLPEMKCGLLQFWGDRNILLPPKFGIMKPATFFPSVICLALLLAPFLVQAQAYTPDSLNWVDKDNLNLSRSYFPAAAWNGKIYVFGGATGPNTATNQIEEYDIATDTWTVLPYTLPQTLCGMAAVELGGAIYVIGGADNYYGTPLSKVYRFHPETGFDPDLTIANLPAPRMFHSACVAPDGKIYVIGGIDPSDQFFNTVFVYDTLTNSWASGESINHVRATHTSAVAGNKIYVIGGTQSFSAGMNSVEVFDLGDPEAVWVDAEPLSNARALHGSAVALGDRIFALGGLGSISSGAEMSVEGFDPEVAGDEWEPFCDLGFERRSFGCVGIGDSIFLIGGNSGGSVIASTQVLRLYTTAAHEVSLSPLENPAALLPNTPNPFDLATEISFKVTKPADIQISIFDATGQLITTPVSGWYGTGEYHIPYDGAGLDAGLYFCVLNGNNAPPSVQKWVVMRK
jgi:hypothetical protein